VSTGLDFKELDGFQFDKDRAIADWRNRKEQAEFGKLVNRLRVLKWQRDVQAEGGSRAAALRARKLRYMQQPDVASRALERARVRRLAAYHASPIVCRCRRCGAEWCPLPRRGVRPAEFCTDACRQIFRYRERSQRPKKRCGRCGLAGHTRRTCLTEKS